MTHSFFCSSSVFIMNSFIREREEQSTYVSFLSSLLLSLPSVTEGGVKVVLLAHIHQEPYRLFSGPNVFNISVSFSSRLQTPSLFSLIRMSGRYSGSRLRHVAALNSPIKAHTVEASPKSAVSLQPAHTSSTSRADLITCCSSCAFLSSLFHFVLLLNFKVSLHVLSHSSLSSLPLVMLTNVCQHFNGSMFYWIYWIGLSAFLFLRTRIIEILL